MRLGAMKALSLAALLLSASNASAGIDFWNSNLTWAGQGQCSAEFTFDSGFEDIQKLEVHFNLVDKTGKVIAADSIALDAFGQSSADRYQQAFLESEEICDDTLRVVVTRATAMIDGKPVDLIKTKGISARDFKPLAIQCQDPSRNLQIHSSRGRFAARTNSRFSPHEKVHRNAHNFILAPVR